MTCLASNKPAHQQTQSGSKWRIWDAKSLKLLIANAEEAGIPDLRKRLDRLRLATLR